MKSLCIAFAMYSKIPVPQFEWDKRSLSWALCWFPLVGVVIGAALWGWLRLWSWLDLELLGAAVAVALPAVLSGAIHLDGFCDTCDALASRQSRERKLEILKDSHTGAFAILCCGLYLLLFTAAWAEADFGGPAGAVLALVPFLSRTLSALAAVSWKNARGAGLLATFTDAMDGRRARVVLLIEAGAVLAVIGLLALDGRDWTLLTVPLGALGTFLYYRVMAYRQFGGITGDTAGYFLQICECVCVTALVLAQRIGEAVL